MAVADPTLDVERELHARGATWVIGCDEVGRGAIAGAGSQIFLRSSPAVAREVRELVASLDVAPRSLWISVQSRS